MLDTIDFAGQPFDRAPFESVLRRRLFYTEAFEAYRLAKNFKGDNRGLFDYGPPGCALQANIVELWRKHFVLEEDMLELDCTALTPEDVFKTSGHVDRFADWMCKDPIKGEYLRADHLVENVLEARLKGDKIARGVTIEPDDQGPQDSKAKTKVKDIQNVRMEDSTVREYEEILARIDNFDGDALGELIKRFDIRNPDGNGEVLSPVPFNLMFKSSIGPSAAAPIYLRPETAQGQFLNFRRLLEYNNNIMPFASASIGKSYRNEISPRSGLLRGREFLMAEIEHFVDPESGKRHPRFDEVKHIELALLDRVTQLAGRTGVTYMSLATAVQHNIVDNETLGYFLCRVQLFLLNIGVDKSKLRFRQHLANEMAHYACDCWDAELLTSYGWIECVGCADRSAYDLTVHAKRTGEKLVVQEQRATPLKVERWEARLDKKRLGPKFRGDARAIEDAVSSLDQETLQALSLELMNEGKVTVQASGLSSGFPSAILTTDLLNIERVTKTEGTREYVPNVIEPSFGIGRILYSLLEQVYWSRPHDAARGVLSLPITVAPTKVLIVPLSSQPAFGPTIKRISLRLRRLGVSNKVDSSSASIGKRYARNDELGTPLGITVDFDTVKNGSITLRERDSTEQVRASEDEVISSVEKLVVGTSSWEDITQSLPRFMGQEIDV